MRICVFCGSSVGRGESYLAAARHLGHTLATRGVGIVYGGASIGTMGALADAALHAGGEVVGVMPRSLIDREIAHRGLTRLEVVDGMHARKARMAELSDGFVALPGGAGTLEELFEVWTWAQLGLHAKPIVVLDAVGYYEPLQTLTAHMVAEGFLSGAHRDMLMFGPEPGALLDRLTSYVDAASTWSGSSAQPSPDDGHH